MIRKPNDKQLSIQKHKQEERMIEKLDGVIVNTLIMVISMIQFFHQEETQGFVLVIIGILFYYSRRKSLQKLTMTVQKLFKKRKE